MEPLSYKNSSTFQIERLFIICLSISFLFVVTIPKWMNIFLFVCAALAIYLLTRINFNSRLSQKNFENSPPLKRWVWLMVITFCSPFLATLLSQLFKQNWLFPEYDSPLRFLLAAPIFLLVLVRQINIAKYWKLMFPITMIATFLILPILPKTGWGNDPTRLATSFADPLTFGRICLTFGLVSLFTINFKKNSWHSSVIQIIGFILGIYLSIRSGSRTGWLAVGPVLILFITTLFEKNRVRAFVIACLVTILGLVSIYKISDTVQERTNLAVTEVLTYKMNEMNPDNSVGMRISFARMGFYYFGLAPFSGLTHQQLLEHRDDPEISRYATEFTRQFPINALFHNELMTHAVQQGVWGIISISLLFFAPLFLFVTAAIKTKDSRIPLLGIAYVMCEVISGMSTDVFNLKFIAALYAIVMAGLCASVLNIMFSNQTKS